jgi:hypothetical protein
MMLGSDVSSLSTTAANAAAQGLSRRDWPRCMSG